MNQKPTTPSLSSDKPQQYPKEDRLGRAPFAQHLAKTLLKMSPEHGFVVALCGPWGSGKTTLLEYVVYYLNESDEKERPIVIRFNPWWFAGRDSLAREYFGQLQAQLPRNGRKFEKARRGLARLSETVSKLPNAEMFEVLSRAVDIKEKSIVKIKEQVAEGLRKANKKILVIMDDIDRLAPDEIGEIFRIIKAIGDLPYVVYLLAFDKTRTSEAIEQSLSLPDEGENYLEKIVQLQLDIPLPDSDSLKSILYEELQNLIGDFPREAIYPPSGLDGLLPATFNEFTRAIDYFIQTPRDVVRLMNVLKANSPAVKGEVHVVDFVGIEILRLFCPRLYDLVRKNPAQFVESGYLFDAPGREDEKKKYVSMVKGESPGAAYLLAYLFPRALVIFDQPVSSDMSVLRRELRVASPEIFPVYFRLSVPDKSISNAEMNTFFSLVEEVSALTAFLQGLSDDRRIHLFLNRLLDYWDREPVLSHASTIIEGLLNVGDQLAGLLGFHTNTPPLGTCVFALLRSIEKEKRFDILENAVRTGKSLYGVVDIVSIYGFSFGKFGGREVNPPDLRQITPEQLQMLETIALKRIREAAKTDTLQDMSLPGIVMAWKVWGGPDEPSSWLNKLISTTEGVLQLIRHSMKPRQEADRPMGFPYRTYKGLLNLNEVADRLRLPESNGELSREDLTLAQEFIKYCPRENSDAN